MGPGASGRARVIRRTRAPKHRPSNLILSTGRANLDGGVGRGALLMTRARWAPKGFAEKLAGPFGCEFETFGARARTEIMARTICRLGAGGQAILSSGRACREADTFSDAGLPRRRPGHRLTERNFVTSSSRPGLRLTRDWRGTARPAPVHGNWRIQHTSRRQSSSRRSSCCAGKSRPASWR